MFFFLAKYYSDIEIVVSSKVFMKKIISLIPVITLLVSCVTSREANSPSSDYYSRDSESITQSLFNDKNASISEENIQKILTGNFKLSENLRVAIVKLESSSSQRKYHWSVKTISKHNNLIWICSHKT